MMPPRADVARQPFEDRGLFGAALFASGQFGQRLQPMREQRVAFEVATVEVVVHLNQLARLPQMHQQMPRVNETEVIAVHQAIGRHVVEGGPASLPPSPRGDGTV